jgi:hypothetical protein
MRQKSINNKLEKFIFEEIQKRLMEEETDFSEMERIFQSELKNMVVDLSSKKSELEKKQNNKEEIKNALKNAPDLANAASNKSNESKKDKINEVDAVFFVGLALALPKIAEIVANLINSLSKKLGGGDKTKIADFLRRNGNKLHHVYLKIVRIALLSVPSFRKSDRTTQDKVAEVVFTLIIAGLAVYSGYSAVKAGITTLGALEGAMAAIKSGEVVQFLSKQFASLA